MTNIWGFLLQTLTVSLVAGILLIVKKILEDKLSPRWQYGVWMILLLQVLVPAHMGQTGILSVPLWVEYVKTKVEALLQSAYSAVYEPVAVTQVLPLLKKEPVSVMDWLFVIYFAGIIFCLLKYFLTYFRLQRILKNSEIASDVILEKAKRVCEKYHLKSCKVVEVPGITSAFLCGGLSPVLAVPAGANLDEKILLHELLHLKYYDTLQNIGWCILRSLHWCNPFLQYVFNCIGNDMESLCDQRVLERLEGEERREYGVILLNMANERYARVPGTSSISNGGKNISKRIESIVRFKKYPKGMALVSVCIVFVLASSTVFGMSGANDTQDFKPRSLAELDIAMAMTRVNRCTTVAGAIDTYAKGLMFDNGIFLATASPIERQEALYKEMQQSSADGWVAYHLQTGYELEYLNTWTGGWYIANLTEQEKNVYSAVLLFDVTQFPQVEDGIVTGVLRTEEGYQIPGCVQIPIEIYQENGWVVEETGEREIVFSDAMSALEELPALKKLVAAGKTGSVTMEMRTRHQIEDQTENQRSIFSGNAFSETPMLGAEFADGFFYYEGKYSIGGKTMETAPESSVGAMFKWITSLEEEPKFPDENMRGNISGSSSDGYEWSSQSITEDWDGILRNGGGGSCDLESDGSIRLPNFCRVQIYWDGELIEEMTAKEVTP